MHLHGENMKLLSINIKITVAWSARFMKQWASNISRLPQIWMDLAGYYIAHFKNSMQALSAGLCDFLFLMIIKLKTLEASSSKILGWNSLAAVGDHCWHIHKVDHIDLIAMSINNATLFSSVHPKRLVNFKLELIGKDVSIRKVGFILYSKRILIKPN
jgi:hypothetical protein